MDESTVWNSLGAIVLAAGQSKRMGQPKLIMPWGQTTVIGQVVQTLSGCGLNEIVVVAGRERDQIEDSLRGSNIRLIFNPEYDRSEMLTSLQIGLAALPDNINAALVVLGDQPFIEPGVVKQVVQAWVETGAMIIAPSYQHRRGHPWLVARELWHEVLSIPPQGTPRDFLNRHSGQIQYIEVSSNTIFKDLDTPEDYRKSRP
jgi:molybdenum cofactor cytidylyltransferase